MTILTIDNIYQHSLILGIYINTNIALINKGPKPLFNTFKAFFEAILMFIGKTKEKLNK